MSRREVTPTGREKLWNEADIIVSKTDLKGVITYANDVFVNVCGYSEAELLGAPHSIIRHPSMPRCVFQYLWDTIEARHEVFAYVKNMAKSGDHYWVFAHVTPTFGPRGDIVGYHSSRRVPDRKAVETLEGIYQVLLAEEQKYPRGPEQVRAGLALLVKTLQGAGVTYDEFIWAQTTETGVV